MDDLLTDPSSVAHECNAVAAPIRFMGDKREIRSLETLLQEWDDGWKRGMISDLIKLLEEMEMHDGVREEMFRRRNCTCDLSSQFSDWIEAGMFIIYGPLTKCILAVFETKGINPIL